MTSFRFYMVSDEYANSYSPSVDSRFYSSIDSVMLDREPYALEYGSIEEYVFIDRHTKVPVHTRTFRVSTIEPYELLDYLVDEPEMNEENYIVYTIEVPNESDLLTIIKIPKGVDNDRATRASHTTM